MSHRDITVFGAVNIRYRELTREDIIWHLLWLNDKTRIEIARDEAKTTSSGMAMQTTIRKLIKLDWISFRDDVWVGFGFGDTMVRTQPPGNTLFH